MRISCGFFGIAVKLSKLEREREGRRERASERVRERCIEIHIWLIRTWTVNTLSNEHWVNNLNEFRNGWQTRSPIHRFILFAVSPLPFAFAGFVVAVDFHSQCQRRGKSDRVTAVHFWKGRMTCSGLMCVSCVFDSSASSHLGSFAVDVDIRNENCFAICFCTKPFRTNFIHYFLRADWIYTVFGVHSTPPALDALN